MSRDPEDAHFVVCGPVDHPLTVNVEGSIIAECCVCKVPVRLALTSPVKPPKICPGCMLVKLKEEEVEGIKAIIFLQKFIGITEPVESARECWNAMTPDQQDLTMKRYEEYKHAQN